MPHGTLSPPDHKWFRNLAVIETLVNLLRPHREQWLSQLRRRGEAGSLAEISAAGGTDRCV